MQTVVNGHLEVMNRIIDEEAIDGHPLQLFAVYFFTAC